ncbi:xylulokinase [Rhabdothermincola sediminis]|uniref:xylulokinase n=1 Tax=Rhabdothermincola sediminis TaxID=2751370 RepID=UPI001AA0178D|nr:FGGY-family carbohydrate kinase [Rhabdothermincola sediminis]
MDGNPAPTFVLAIDLGTGGPKIALVSTEGEVIAHTVRRNGLILVPGGGVEQDPEEWWSSIVDGIGELLGRQLVPVRDIVAISITAQWMATVPVDETGTPLANAVSWMDDRGSRYVKKVTGGGLSIPTVGYNARKLRRWLQVTGGVPSRTGKDSVGHILWLKHERPGVYRDTYKFLEPMDFLNMRLTGRFAASYDSIVGHWVTDNRDLSRVAYDEELLSWTGIDRDKLPDLLPTGSVVGPITPERAKELGLGEHVQVITGTGDTSSAGIGAGAVRDFDGHLYVGTSSWLSCHVPFKKTDLLHNITSLPSGIPSRYWVATEQDVAGASLTWLIDNVLLADDALSVVDAPDDMLESLNGLAASSPPGSNGVLFFPWLNGERTPVDDHRIRGGWINLGLGTQRADLVRAVFEGVALNARWMLVYAERFAKRRFDGLTYIGGGALSPLWCQVMADVLDRPIRQAAEPRLANVRGAAFSAAVALGYLRWEDIPTRVAITETFTPDPSTRATYDRAFEAFTEYYKRTKGIFATLNRHPRGPS